MKHGTLVAYNHHKCRCEECRAKLREYMRVWMRRTRERYKEEGVPEHVHGSLNGYNNYSCRCEACAAAMRGWGRQRKARKLEGVKSV